MVIRHLKSARYLVSGKKSIRPNPRIKFITQNLLILSNFNIINDRTLWVIISNCNNYITKILPIMSITIILIAIMIAYFGSLFVIARNALIAKNLPIGINQYHNFNSNNERSFWVVISNWNKCIYCNKFTYSEYNHNFNINNDRTFS